MPDTFVLTRILGNDLPPRHGERQTIANLAFLLDNEAAFPNCTKRWVVNRIADAGREADIIALLNARGQPFVHIPFELAKYGKRLLDADALPDEHVPLELVTSPVQPPPPGLALEWIYRHKNLYAVNVNGARNVAIADGLATGARWIMPWDGACFLTEQAFAEIATLAMRNPEARYLSIPMARSHDDPALLQPGYRPAALTEEPQLVFRNDASERFDESLRYGHLSKAELLRRIGVPGPWQKWGRAKWEQFRVPITADHGRFAVGGWVVRLDPAAAEGVEANSGARWRSRLQGLVAHCASLDRRVVDERRAGDGLICYGTLLAACAPDGPQAAEIVAAARTYLDVQPVSVTQKSALLPGLELNDYASIRRYVHRQPDGSWTMRDGVPNPAALAGGEGAENYDRFRLQTMIDAVTALALGTHFTGDGRFSAHGAAFVRTWFIDPSTRMNPHMRFAQLVPDRPDDHTMPGLVDFRDFVALADAIRMLHASGALSDADAAAVAAWFASFRDDMLSRMERAVALRNNIGVFHDLLFATVASASGDTSEFAAALSRAPLRFLCQIGIWGWQPTETERTLPLHYSLFALQALIGLASVGRASGVDLWRYSGAERRSIPMAARFAAQYRSQLEDYASAPVRFDDRIELALRLIPDDAADVAAVADLPRRRIVDVCALDSTDGFAPWVPILLATDAELGVARAPA